MFNIPRIEKESFYIDQAMKSMQEYATKERLNIGQRFSKSVGTQRKTKEEVNLNKRKDLELEKIRYLNTSINRAMRKLIKRFPNMQKLDEIYLQLINTSETPIAKIKDSLSLLLWIANAADEFTQNTEWKLKKAKSQETLGFLMKKHLGKINSLFRKNKEAFQILEQARKFMNTLPTFEDLYTVSIAGYPNVGKSTLMKKITGSNVEIQNYPFTTKGLMFSYLEENGIKAVQIIDTPGLLGREGKSNPIEERAEIVLNQFCNQIIFVLDFTQSCGYSIEKQLKLLKKVSTLNKPLSLYLSKTDIFDEEDEERLNDNNSKIKKYKIIKTSEDMKKEILEAYKKTKERFDPSKLKLIK